jgi:hypothetical protein
MRTSATLAISLSVLLSATIASATQPPDPTASDAHYNTAAGSYALNSETTGALNSAIGYEALYRNTTGGMNTALGASALFNNVGGSDNVAAGTYALHTNGSGADNTVAGYYAMYNNTSGSQNTAVGSNAIVNNTTGYWNTALGFAALAGNVAAFGNTAIGTRALNSSSGGNTNTAVGLAAMQYSTTGYNNTTLGAYTLGDNFLGFNNIAIGYEAGSANGDNSNNIDIGHMGSYNDVGFIRIGTPGTQTTTFIAGINGAQITGAAVYVNSAGQLGVLASSSRYKTQIAPMGASSEKLGQLRPVTFHLKSDPQGSLQFGLIAEEVDRVYPELVIRDSNGMIQGVRYDELAPLLLNEVQMQRSTIKEQAAKLDQLTRQLTALNDLRQEMQAAVRELRSQRLAMANEQPNQTMERHP